MQSGDPLHQFFAREWEWYLQHDPIFATQIGETKYNDQLPDYSMAAIRAEEEHDRQALKELKSLNSPDLSADERVSYNVFEYRMKMNVEEQSFPSYLMPINQLLGIHHDLPLLPERTTFREKSDYDAYLVRLQRIPRLIDQVIELMREGLRKKLSPPKVAVRDVERQIQSLVAIPAEESPFYEPFQESGNKDARQIIETAIRPSFQKLLNFWSFEYFPNTRNSVGASELPNGEAWYEFQVRLSTTTDLTPAEIHRIGLDEVARIHSEMKRMISKTGFVGSYSEFLQFLRTDPQFFYTDSEDLVRGYRDICKRIDPELPRLFGKLPRLPYGVKAVPEYIAPSQPTAYYEPGSLKAARPGWYYANAFKLNTRPKWEMEVLSVHEAVPGHHLQFAIVEELERLPEFRKHWKYTSYVEGWGLYSESLGEELGLYQDPYSKFGQLTYEMWRAVRLVIDTGIHAMGWTRDQAISYFRENAGKQEHDIHVEVDRYIVWPGQALAYKIGERKVKELRKFAEQKLGPRFHVREFHDCILGNGPLPLTMLHDLVMQFVDSHA